jgi:hypothetical protein
VTSPVGFHRKIDVDDGGALPVVQNLVQRSVQHPETPVTLGLILLVFLLVQHRFDRRDPKLRVLPRGQYEDLEFGRVVGRA